MSAFRMKKNIAMLLAALLIAVMLTGAAALVIRLLAIVGGNQMEKIDFEKEFTMDELQEIENLSFQNQEGTMRIVLGDGFSVKGKDVPESFVGKVKNGTLVVAYTEGSRWNSRIWAGNDFRDAEITITIPRDFVAGEIELCNSSGKLEFSGLEAEGFLLDNGSGMVVFSGMKAGDMKIENGSGKLEGTELTGGELRLSSNSGPTILKQVTADMAEVDSGSGIVSMDEAKIKGLELSSGSGAFELAGRVDGDLEINSGSGNVSITLENARAEYSICADTGSGALWLDGERLEDFQEENPTAAYAIEINSGSGRVAIGFLDGSEKTGNQK